MKNIFTKVSAKISKIMGNAYAFIIAVLLVTLWAVSGPFFGYSDTWQLAINTTTTIVTFLMVFLIQNTQNRDSKAMQLKLDELIRASNAREFFVDLEDLSDDELEQLDKEFQTLHQKNMSTQAMHKLHKSIQIEHHLRRAGVKHSRDKLREIVNKLNNKN